MIHLFHIHNYSSYLTAIGVVKEKGLSLKDVRFILCRGLKRLSPDHIYYDFSDRLYYFPFTTLRKLKSFHFLKTCSIIKEIDSVIDNLTSGNFYLYYTPNSRNYLYRVFISNSLCRGVEYIEDGMDMYLQADLYEKKYPYRIPYYQVFFHYMFYLLIQCNRRIKPHRNPFKGFYRHSPLLYGLSNNSFKHLRSDMHFKKVDISDFKFELSNDLKPVNDYLLLDAVVEQGVIIEKHFKKFINDFSNNFNKKTIGIKFHPFQADHIKNFVLESFQDSNVKYVQVNDDVPFELVLFKKEGLSIYGIGSSLLNYASFNKSHDVYTFYPYFKSILNYISPRHEFWAETFESNKMVRIFGRDFWF